jgi:hypothetical protein
MERHSVLEQPHELKYEARKTGTTPKKAEAAKKPGGSNQRSGQKETQEIRWKRKKQTLTKAS